MRAMLNMLIDPPNRCYNAGINISTAVLTHVPRVVKSFVFLNVFRVSRYHSSFLTHSAATTLMSSSLPIHMALVHTGTKGSEANSTNLLRSPIPLLWRVP